ncbi:unnamed protein product [Polarella glacialis]|uniref:Crossover junction endonuclease MUS81 n=1 Tax=Polarella glacialis TaxID=89957 RepID=A0A813M4L8_POLGL|nr:unnamed protein product [Polarella glacialis]CAE8743531.1 unnamed protein product [Polarella glacialis]
MMNNALRSYLEELRSKAREATPHYHMLTKSIKTVRSARSPLNPAALEHCKNFGSYVGRRVAGHFSKDENQLPEPGSEDEAHCLKSQVRSVVLSGDQALGRVSSKTLEKFCAGLAAFQVLLHSRDLRLLRDCENLAASLEAHFPPQRRSGTKRASSAGGAARPQVQVGMKVVAVAAERAKKRRRKSTGAEAAIPRGAEQPAQSDSRGSRLIPSRGASSRLTVPSSRSHKKNSGPWAVMVALYITNEPQTKDDLVRLSAEHRLCSEPLVRLQRTAAHVSQRYSPWSGVLRLVEKGWVLRSEGRYSLTEAGRMEAEVYAHQHEGISAPRSLQGAKPLQCARPESTTLAFPTTSSQPSSVSCAAPVSSTAEDLADDSDGDDVCLMQSSGSPPLAASWRVSPQQTTNNLAKQPATNNQQQPLASSWRVSREVLRRRWARGVLSPPPTNPPLVILIDVNEKPIIRSRLAQQLLATPPTELALPGVDYAFGRRVGQEWSVGRVLLERKTVYDYLDTLDSARGELQGRLQATLREQGFRVAVVLEGTRELVQHPREAELLQAAFAGGTDVLTTTSVDDTSELIAAMAEVAEEHEGWTTDALRVLLQAHYEPDPQRTCEVALRLVGVAPPAAATLAQGFGALSALLAQLPVPGADAACAVEAIAAKANMTLYQSGLALRALGVGNAPLPRTRRKRSAAEAAAGQEAPEVEEELDSEQAASVCFGRGVSSAMIRHLKALLGTQLQSKCSEELEEGGICVRRGCQVRQFSLSDGSSPLLPGRHWLLVASARTSWQEVTRARAFAYVRHGVVSSSCTSPDQAARHIAACAEAFGRPSAAGERLLQRPFAKSCRHGLSSVLCLSRTGGGALPEATAKALAARLDCSLAELVHRLRRPGSESAILELAVPNVGPERASAVRALLIGS